MNRTIGSDFDFLMHIEDELTQARKTASRAVGRVEALIEFRSHALAKQEQLGRPVYAADVVEPLDPHDEHERAHLNALIDRIAPEEAE